MRIITGSCCDGKTAYIYEQIKQDLIKGEQVLLIVPEGDAVESETRLMEYLSGTPSQCCDVYGFSRMCNDFFRKYGGLCYNYIDKTASDLLMFLTLCNIARSLTEYRNIKISDKDIISALNSSIKQLKVAGVGPSLLEKTIAEMRENGDVDEKTLARLDDILTVYSAREALLKNGYDDPDDDITHMLSMISENKYFEKKCIYLDSFSGFTKPQYELIRFMLDQAKAVTAAVDLPGDIVSELKDTVYAPVYETYTQLCKCAHDKKKEVSTVYIDRSDKQQALKCFEKSMVNGEEYRNEDDTVKLYSFSDVYNEVDAVCADICKKIRNDVRFRDIAVIVPDTSVYSGILDDALKEHDIDAYISDKGKLAEKNFIKFVFSALKVCSTGFSAESVITYIKTGLHRLDDDTVFEFENYVKTWNISGKYFYCEPWDMSPSGYRQSGEYDEAVLERVNGAKDHFITPLYDLYSKISSGEQSADAYITALYGFFTQTDVGSILAELNEKTREYLGEKEAMEQQQVWDRFFSALSTLKMLCTDTPLTCEMFSDLLSMVINCVDIGTIPTSADQVLICDMNSLYGTGRAHVYILGAVEGKLPPEMPESAFTRSDIVTLYDYDLPVGMLEENYGQGVYFNFFKACSGAKESLWISFYEADPFGAECRISPYLDGMAKSFVRYPLKTLYGTDVLYSKKKCLQFYAENKDTDEGRTVGELLNEDDSLQFLTISSEYPLSNTNDMLSEETAKALYRGELKLSNSKIDAFNKCKFAYYCKYGLYLEEKVKAQIGADGVGTLVHFVLQRLLEDYMEDKQERIFPYTPLQLCDRYLVQYISEMLHISPETKRVGRIRAMFNRVKRNLERVVSHVLRELEQSDFQPVNVEMSINYGSDIKPVRIQLEDGGTACLTGIVDRVDAYEKDGVTYLRLTDYKTGDISFDIDKVKELEGIQLLMYMVSICQSDGKKYKPAAVLYMGGMVQETDTFTQLPGDDCTLEIKGAVLNDEDIDHALAHDGRYSAIAKNKKIHVMTDAEFEQCFSELMEGFACLAMEMKSGIASAQPKETGERGTCKYCAYKFLCRRTEKR